MTCIERYSLQDVTGGCGLHRTMTHVSTPILLELHSAESLSSQIAALRKLKNETVGHGQRKELWIRGGIISILSKILALRRTTERRTGVQDLNGTVEFRESLSSRSEEEDACLQAIIIVGSLAQGILSCADLQILADSFCVSS